MPKYDKGFSDLLNFAHLVEDGLIINKDGALMLSFEGRGPDLQSASGSELDALSHTMNQMAQVLEDGWMLHIDEIRFPCQIYPELGHFPDSVSRLIDEERRQQYESEGSHFENKTIFTFVWKFPKPKVNVLQHWFVEGADVEEDAQSLQLLIHEFKEKVNRCEGLLSLHLWLKKMNSQELLSYLNTCISGEVLPVSVPPEGCFLDVALGRHNVVGGFKPQVGDKTMTVLSLASYLNEETRPALLESLGTYPLVYRWSNRFVFLSEHTAEKAIKKFTVNWSNKVKGMSGIFKEAFTGTAPTKLNGDAMTMKTQSLGAETLNQSQTTRFGYFTSNILLMHEDPQVLSAGTQAIRRYLEQTGFGVIEENVNAMEAWLGSIPGHGARNIRRMFVNSVNWAHCLPLHTTWSGNREAHPSSLLKKGSPPVFYAQTSGNTPFRFWADVQDSGHILILGPNGAGKSTFLQFYMAQFLRYKNAKIFIFDKDFSHEGLTLSLSGDYYRIQPDNPMQFAPLADLSTEAQVSRVGQWIIGLLTLQGLEPDAEQKNLIFDTLNAWHLTWNESPHRPQYNLSLFVNRLQDKAMREALRYYTLSGGMPMLDSTHDSLGCPSPITAFEQDWLLRKENSSVGVPVLSYLIDKIDAEIEKSNAESPAVIVIEEAWLAFKNALLAEKVIDWAKVLRKKNGRIIFATQSLSDLYTPETGELTTTTAAILEACYTRVFLPNPNMDKKQENLYLNMELTERECEMLRRDAIPKRHYFVKRPDGQRLIELGFDASHMALCFIGLGKKKMEQLKACQQEHGTMWVYHWLKSQGFPEWGEYWLKNEGLSL